MKISMPTVSRFYGITIKMFFIQREHQPPHFHAMYGEYNALFAIDSLEMIEPFRLRAIFIDGTEKEYDLQRWQHRPEFSSLFRHSALQTAVRIEPGGYGISWNDNIDLSAEEIYGNGTDVDCATSAVLLDSDVKFQT
jgi:hypothetical protein